MCTLTSDPEYTLTFLSAGACIGITSTFGLSQFAKEMLYCKYCKHNRASFVGQLNLHGFWKVVHFEQGSLVIDTPSTIAVPAARLPIWPGAALG